MLNIFKREKPAEPYDYPVALTRLAAACSQNKSFTLILPSVSYDIKKGLFCVRFECAQKEFFETKKGKHKHFLSIRRDERFWSKDLEALIDYCVTYANYDDAFIRSPKDNLPEGVTVNIKNFNRIPRNNSLTWKTK